MKLGPTLRQTAEFGIGLTAIATLMLAGCGGGGSSSADGGVAATKVSGVAAKGIIKYALVTAYELDAQGNIVRTVGNSETDATGKYSLTIGSSYAGGPIKLELTPKSDGSTLMVCDVATGCGTGIAFGQDYPLPPAFALAAYQPSVSKTNATVTSQITPYTNMVAANVQSAVQAGATLNNDLVSLATSKISTLVGVNISTTEPVDITNASAVAAASANSLQYGAFNAAIGDIAFADGNGFASGVQAAAEAFADGQFDSSDAVTIADITTAVQTEVTTAPTLSTTTNTAGTASVTDQLTVISDSTTSGTYTPAATATATMTPLAQAKALVSQTRTWVTQIAALQTPATAFGNNVSIAGAVLNSNSAVLGGVFGQMLGQALNTVQMAAASTAGLAKQTYTYPINYWNGTAMVSGSGSVVVSVASNGTLTLTLPSTVTAGVTTAGTVTTTIPSSILGVQTTSLNLGTTNAMTVTGAASMSTPTASSITINNATLNLALKTAINSSTLGNSESNIASLGIDGDITMAANGVSFNGTGTFAMVANNVANAVKPFSLSKIALSGTFTDNTTTPASSANASASVTFNNAATFDVIGLLSHQPVVWVGTWQPGDPFGIAPAYANAFSGDTLMYGYYDSYSNQTCGQGAVNGWGCASGDYFGLTTKIQSAFSASYPTANGIQNAWANYDATYGTNYGGMLTFPDFESASNFANVTVTVSSNVALAGNPAATLTVTANRTAYGSSAKPFAGDVVALLAFNGQSVKFQASNTGTTAGTLTITNPDGVAMVLSGTAGSTTGTVSASGTQVGTISASGGITTITYTDGSFESLN